MKVMILKKRQKHVLRQVVTKVPYGCERNYYVRGEINDVQGGKKYRFPCSVIFVDDVFLQEKNLFYALCICKIYVPETCRRCETNAGAKKETKI